MEPIDVILTSYNRWNLLTRTLDSFFTFNTCPINNFFIYEDYGEDRMDEDQKKQLNSIKDRYPMITFIIGNERVGQIQALDILLSKVTTEYYFSLEDDWEFYNHGFVEESKKILDAHPTCMQVWLRELYDTNTHPVIRRWGIFILKLNHQGRWHGFSFNPSLRRLKDYQSIGSYSLHAVFNPTRPYESEIAIGKLYLTMGFFAAILPSGYVRHIGDEHGIRN